MIDLVTTAIRNELKVTYIIPVFSEVFQPGVLANEKSRSIRQQLPGLDGFFGLFHGKVPRQIFHHGY